MAVFLGQLIFLLVVIIALQRASWLNGTAFGVAALAVALVWQVFQVVAYVRSRKLAFDAPPESGQDGGSAT
jgi:ATP synthase protein I